jgi:hypothetical protein
MKTSRFSINGINKGKLLAAALPIGLILAPQVVFAHDDVAGGASRVSSITINDALNFQNIVSRGFNLPTGTHQCVATGSAEANNPNDGKVDHRYIFGLALDQAVGQAPNPEGGSERTIEFDDTNAADDVEKVEVSSTFTFTNVPAGQHTIFWMAKKGNNQDANMTVQDASLSIICVEGSL